MRAPIGKGLALTALSSMGLGAALLAGAALTMAAVPALAFSLKAPSLSLPKPKPRVPVTIESVLGQLKVKLVSQGAVSYVVTGRDRRGAETDTPQTNVVVYTDISWPDRCILKVKSNLTIQDNVDDGWRETHPVEVTVDLHDLKPVKHIDYSEYLTRTKGGDAGKAGPETRFHVMPRNISVVQVGDANLIVAGHAIGGEISHILDKAGAMCHAESAAVAPKPAG
jgi:hypothetical protein